MAATRAGYVYVLATSYHSGGVPVVKIGMTTRTPEQRAAELSRGGPVGMTLLGFVTTRDVAGLEQAAHRKYQHARLSGSGGTEYFSADPAEILSWLRAATPKFELDSARKSAWADYCASAVHKKLSRAVMIPIFLGGAGFWVGLLWHPFDTWSVVLGGPVGFALGIIVLLPFRRYFRELETQLAALRGELEIKYHLPPGGVHH